MEPTPDQTAFWFLNTLVKIRVSHSEGTDQLAIMVHHAPFGDSPPLHIHRNQDEGFIVLDGEIRLNQDGRESRAVAGDYFLAPKDVPHSYRVASRSGARFVTITRGGDFEGLIRFLGRPAASDGLPPQSGPPSPEQAASLVEACARFGIDIVGPPLG